MTEVAPFTITVSTHAVPARAGFSWAFSGSLGWDFALLKYNYLSEWQLISSLIYSFVTMHLFWQKSMTRKTNQAPDLGIIIHVENVCTWKKICWYSTQVINYLIISQYRNRDLLCMPQVNVAVKQTSQGKNEIQYYLRKKRKLDRAILHMDINDCINQNV